MRNTTVHVPPAPQRPLLGGCAGVIGVGLLVVGLIYWGYCWGWWGRERPLLMALWQCACPPSSEAARWAPFTVLVSACEQPRGADVAPSGDWLIFTTQDRTTPPR